MMNGNDNQGFQADDSENNNGVVPNKSSKESEVARETWKLINS